MPNWCKNEIEITGNKEGLVKLADFVKGEKSDFDFNKIIPIHSKNNAVECQSEYWGTKWNADNLCLEFEDSMIWVRFYTAWSPSEPVTKTLSELFPNLTFKHSSDEPSCDFSGYVIFKNGEIIERKEGSYEEYCIDEEED